MFDTELFKQYEIDRNKFDHHSGDCQESTRSYLLDEIEPEKELSEVIK
jgi:hypothetical protein